MVDRPENSDQDQPRLEIIEAVEYVSNTASVEDVNETGQVTEGAELVDENAVSLPEEMVKLANDDEVKEVVASAPGAWQRLRRLFITEPSDVTLRLDELTRALEHSPEAASNFLLRAEIYMEIHEYALAHADFQRAYELAAAQFEVADWGLLEQSIRDRALLGMEKALRRL